MPASHVTKLVHSPERGSPAVVVVSFVVGLVDAVCDAQRNAGPRRSDGRHGPVSARSRCEPGAQPAPLGASASACSKPPLPHAKDLGAFAHHTMQCQARTSTELPTAPWRCKSCRSGSPS